MGESGWELSGRSTVEAHLVKPSRIRARTAEMPRPEIERVLMAAEKRGYLPGSEMRALRDERDGAIGAGCR